MNDKDFNHFVTEFKGLLERYEPTQVDVLRAMTVVFNGRKRHNSREDTGPDKGLDGEKRGADLCGRDWQQGI